ncbi:MAG TPA: PadR family transcriptional regulator [Anaerolineae bacterium]|nr:PadR family transcriptional regulator [Anaerolineae bacterium]
MPRKNTAEIDELLKNWEEVYKKGLLTFWILLLLHDRPGYAYEMSAAIGELSEGTITADENSIYRALNRFEPLGIVQSELKQSDVGPQRRYYRLTENGTALLAKFVQRNVLVFEKPEIAERIQAIVTK